MNQNYKISTNYLIIPLLVFIQCFSYSQTKLKLLTPKESGIYFRNDILETSARNVMVQGQIYEYNGGGVAVGDLDNDGIEDLVFTGNCKTSAVYKNLGNLKFEDKTNTSGFNVNGWCTGVCIADINNDGLLDIYICKSRYPDSNASGNQLFINKGNFTFRDETQKYGLDFNGNSIHGTFFDFDLDGDLDFYLMVHPIENDEKGLAFDIENLYPKIYGTDILYENLGKDGGFINASYRLGSRGENAFGLGVIATDLDEDGLVDIYVSNDFVQQDFFYKNLGNGNFKECLYEHFAHTSYFSMGVDANDFNNDGLPDLFAADMSSSKLIDLKQQMNGFYYNFYNRAIANHGAQHVRNSLQLNMGNGKFSEMANFSGVASTDWSWSPLFVDIDMDGYKDLIISNGIKRDILNQEFYLYKYDSIRTTFTNGNYWNDSTILSFVAPYRSANLFYKNNKDLQFISNSTNWGTDDIFNSNGAAYADLDNDGDIEIIFNNTDTFASIYKNLTIENDKSNWIELDIMDDQTRPYGTKIYLYANNQIQFQSLCNSRGYQSKSTDIIHFGLGNSTIIDSIKIIFPDQSNLLLLHPEINTKKKIFKEIKNSSYYTKQEFKEIKLIYKSEIIDTIIKSKDFITQPLLYKTISDIGPASLLLSNKREVYIGAYMNQSAKIINLNSSKLINST